MNPIIVGAQSPTNIPNSNSFWISTKNKENPMEKKTPNNKINSEVGILYFILSNLHPHNNCSCTYPFVCTQNPF